MADFSGDEVIRGSELRADPILADVKFLRGGYERLVQTSTQHSELLASMATVINEVQQSVSQLSKQLGKQPIRDESPRQTPPVQFSSDPYVRDDPNPNRFIEFPIFTGVSGDLRPWISWLENFFVREKFTADEKLNLAQSLLEGEAEVWFYRNQKMLPFQSWEDLKANLWLTFGDFAYLDRIRRNPVNRCRKTTSLHTIESFSATEPIEKAVCSSAKDESITQTQVAAISGEKKELKKEVDLSLEKIASPLPLPNTKATIKEKITVAKSSNQQNIIEEFSENVADILEEKKLIPQCQVPNSSLGPSLSFSSESLDVSQAWQSEIVSNNRVPSQSGFASVKNMNNAHHVFDELSHRRHKCQQRKTVSLSPKSRMFKFKHKPLLSNWSQMDLHQVIDMSKVNNQSPCFSANFGLVRPKRPFQCLRLQKQAHLSRVLYQMRMLHDPGGMKQLLHGDIALHRVMSKTLEEFCVDHENSIMRLKLLLHSGFAGDKLTELDFHLRENHRQEKKTGFLVFPWNLLPLEFFWFIHLEDKVCLSGASNSWWGWLVFDRGKSNIISGNVITLVSSKELWMEILDGDIAKLLNSTCGKLQSYDYGLEITFLRRLRVHQQQQKRKFIKSWRFKYKSSLRNTRSESREINQFVGFLKFQLKHKWRSKHLPISALEVYLSSVLPTVTSATSSSLLPLYVYQMIVSDIQDNDKEMVADLRLTVWRVLYLLGTLFWSTSFKKEKFGKNWWYKFKHSLWQREWDSELLAVEVVMAATVMDVRIDDVGRSELLVKWQDHDASENFWMFSKDFVQLYPSSKLEDKLVFEGGSIDTIKQSYYRKKKPWVETEGFSCKEALEGNGGFAVSLEV